MAQLSEPLQLQDVFTVPFAPGLVDIPLFGLLLVNRHNRVCPLPEPGVQDVLNSASRSTTISPVLLEILTDELAPFPSDTATEPKGSAWFTPEIVNPPAASDDPVVVTWIGYVPTGGLSRYHSSAPILAFKRIRFRPLYCTEETLAELG
jgi:hypothetical protein